MRELEEIAVSIANKVGLPCLQGMRSMRDAQAIVGLYMPTDETPRIKNEVAIALLAIARAAQA